MSERHRGYDPTDERILNTFLGCLAGAAALVGGIIGWAIGRG